MKTRPSLAHTAYQLLAEGRVADLGKRVASRLYGQCTSYGLRRDLQVPFAAPKAKIPIAVRKLIASDIPVLLPDQSGLDTATSWDIRVRRAHLESEIPQGDGAGGQGDGTSVEFQWRL